MNSTQVETLHSMLIDGDMDFGQKLSTSVYLRKRSPTKDIEDMTLFEAWMKQKP